MLLALVLILVLLLVLLQAIVTDPLTWQVLHSEQMAMPPQLALLRL